MIPTGESSPDIDNDNSALNIDSSGNADSFHHSSYIQWNSCGQYTLLQVKIKNRSPYLDYDNGTCYVFPDGGVGRSRLIITDSFGRYVLNQKKYQFRSPVGYNNYAYYVYNDGDVEYYGSHVDSGSGGRK